MRRVAVVLIVGAGLVVALVGCEGVPTSGAIAEQSLQPGIPAKDIPFTAANGTRTSLNAIRQPVTVVAFTTPPGEYCCWISPALTRLSSQLWNLPVTVAEVSTPTSPCPHGAECSQACDMGKHQLVALCDEQRIAWRAYGEPASGTVFLLDKSGKVVQRGTLTDLGPIRKKAESLGQEARTERMSEF